MPEQKNLTGLDNIKELVALMKENDLVEIEVVDGDDKIHLKRPQPAAVTQVHAPAPYPVAPAAVAGVPQVPSASAAQPQQVPAQPQTQPEDDLVEIKSPIVGTFYSAPSPDSDPYVKVGDHVEPDMVVCIVEAMKVMNELKAEVSGTIVKVLPKTGQAVEYDQVLFKVKPD